MRGVPGAVEAGRPGFVAAGWFGVVLPKDAPAPIVERLSKAIEVIANAPQTAERFTQNGSSVEKSTPTGFAKVIDDDHQRWGEVIRAAKVKIE